MLQSIGIVHSWYGGTPFQPPARRNTRSKFLLKFSLRDDSLVKKVLCNLFLADVNMRCCCCRRRCLWLFLLSLLLMLRWMLLLSPRLIFLPRSDQVSRRPVNQKVSTWHITQKQKTSELFSIRSIFTKKRTPFTTFSTLHYICPKIFLLFLILPSLHLPKNLSSFSYFEAFFLDNEVFKRELRSSEKSQKIMCAENIFSPKY